MTQAPEYRLVPVEPTEAMIAAAAQTPGMRAIDASSSIMQARGYPLDPAAFEGGSPLAQAYRAMLAAAPHTATPAADRAVSELPKIANYLRHEAWTSANVERGDLKQWADMLDALARSTDAPSEPVAWWRWSYEALDGGHDADVQIGTDKPTCLPDNGYSWEPLYGTPLAPPPAATTSTETPTAPKDETAWLVEMHNPGAPYPLHYLHLQGHGTYWPADASKATQFVRKQDADDAMAFMHSEDRRSGCHRPHDYRVAEHCWPAAATSTETPVSTPGASGEASKSDRCEMCNGRGLIGIPVAPCPGCAFFALGKRYQAVVAAESAIAASQAPAVPATELQCDVCGEDFDAMAVPCGLRECPNVPRPGYPSSWAATPTASNAEDARSMGAVSEGVPWQLIEIGKRVAEAYRDGSLDGGLIGHLRDMLQRAEALPTAARDVLAERRRQVEKGRTLAHDDEHDRGEIAEQAAVFLMTGQHCMQSDWAWKHKHPDGPDRKDRRKQLVMGTALALAEIERLDRAALTQAASTGGAAS